MKPADHGKLDNDATASGRNRVWVRAVVILLLTPGSVWPWGRTGHRVSAMMAESRLTPAALAAVRSILEPGESLADASTWADEQRELPRTGPWHYVNVPISEPRFDPHSVLLMDA
jgi:hypothetical protein